MNRNCRTTAYVLAVIASTSFLTGCFFSPSPPTFEEQTEKVGQFIAKGGYSSKRNDAIDSMHEVWRHDGQALEITMLAPKTPGLYPLIIYLPGLGEHAEGGRLWREAWAKAGYAVFSLQPVEIAQALKEIAPISEKSGDGEESGVSGESNDSSSEDSKSRSSRNVRNSDLRYLGHEYFSPEFLKKRINEVLWSYSQLKLRSKAGKPLFARADLSKLIIAGYDIGAQTASGMIGENFDTDLPNDPDFKPMAAILLSPFVDMAGGNLTTRYQAISIPLLTITGTEDDDQYGISSPYVRTAIWEYAPPDFKYLLLLNKERHQLLAGSSFVHQQENSSSEEPAEKNGPGADVSRFTHSYRGGRNKGGGSGGGHSGGMGHSKPGGRHDYEQDFKHIAAVLSISTAFLDSISKSDKAALSWLANEADQWLTKTARLKSK